MAKNKVKRSGILAEYKFKSIRTRKYPTISVKNPRSADAKRVEYSLSPHKETGGMVRYVYKGGL